MQKYHTCTASTPEALDREVEEYLNDGWHLQGGVSVAIIPDKYVGIYDEQRAAVFAQAVWCMDGPAKVDALKEPAEAVA